MSTKVHAIHNPHPYPMEPSVSGAAILGMVKGLIAGIRREVDIIRLIGDVLQAFYDMGVAHGRMLEARRRAEAARSKQ